MSQFNSLLILDVDENAGNEYNQVSNDEDNVIYYMLDAEGIKYYESINFVQESSHQSASTSILQNDSIYIYPNKYICDHCGKTFSQKNNIRLHMNRHKFFEFECHACGKKYKTIQSLRYHLRQHFEIYSCEICGQEFKHKKLFIAHNASAHNQELLIKCNFCARKFARIDIRDAHERSVHHVNGNYHSAQYNCKEKPCQESFIYRNELVNHMILHHYTGNIHSCHECGKNFKKKSLLTQHMKIHEKNTMKYFCDICQQSFTYKSGLIKHLKRNRCNKILKIRSLNNFSKHQMKEIAKKQLLEITVSNSSVVKNLKLQSSIENDFEKNNRIARESNMNLGCFNEAVEHYNDVKFNFICDICNANYKTKVLLSKHIKNTHLLEMNSEKHLKIHKITKALYKCPECDKVFKREFDVVSHQKNTHSSIKIYVKCEQCGKTILERSLKSHMINQHSEKANYKPFICEYCGKRERYEKNILRHVNSVHIPQNRGITYKCPDCPEIFFRVRDLRAHSFVHFTGKIYSCDLCNKQFKKNYDLRTHMNAHKNSQVPKQCPKCNRFFQTKSGLYRHLRNHD
ncbi:hypothetical protein PVAND_001840 [Polypedilum vanderplanki]|uniref:C2H2-type domain-containing protein n=1 Tax=Polypedilum vanderplanki TaxID=319348 RepID=A0A9J6BP49_POLVA|nr:hypothetical protein PVAND_001840 [Polypedilum vanderplanki]